MKSNKGQRFWRVATGNQEELNSFHCVSFGWGWEGTTFNVIIWEKTHGGVSSCESRSLECFCNQGCIVQMGLHKSAGPTAVLALIITWARQETVKANCEEDRGQLYSFDSWVCGWLGITGLPFPVPLIPLSFLNSSWHVNRSLYSLDTYFSDGSLAIPEHWFHEINRSTTLKAPFSSHPRRMTPQEGGGLLFLKNSLSVNRSTLQGTQSGQS